MQTQLMPDVSSAQATGPWLERVTPESGVPGRVMLLSFPFKIGRQAPADLLVNSSRVSREHAVIEQCDDGYMIQDRGSTNGTFVNGRRINESPLNDGDVVTIADVEFTFGGVATAQVETTTQSLQAVRHTTAGGEDLVRAVRRLHEAMTQRSVPARLAPIVCLADDTVCAYQSHRHFSDDSETRGFGRQGLPPRAISEAECRLTTRWRQLERLLAVELALHTSDATRVFVDVAAQELGSAELVDSLLQLGQVLGGRRLVIALPDSAVSDAPALRELCQRLRAESIGVAHVGFAAAGAQLRQRQEFAPDFLQLANSLVRGLHRSDPHRRQVQEIVKAAGELGVQLIAAGVSNDEEAAVCRELACPWASGPYYSHQFPSESHGTAVTWA